MAITTFGDGLWAFMVVGGFLILGAAIAWAKFNNKQTPREEARTEAATRDLYQDGATETRPGD